MLYPQFGERKCIFLIIYSVSKAYSFIYSNKHSKQQREKEYVFVCLRYVTGMYSYVIRMSQVCIRMSSLCHSYVLVCHSYVTCIYSHVIHISLVCGFTVNQSRAIEKKSTFISTNHVQNLIKLKQNFLNNLFQYFSNLFHLSLGYCQYHLHLLSKH